MMVGFGDRGFRLFFCGFLFLSLSGCNYARMNDQESVRTYETIMPEMPEGTIPIQGGLERFKKAAPTTLKNPLSSTSESWKQGEEAYKYFCIQCHGPQADGNGTVGQSFAPLPSDLRDKAVQRQTDGELFVKVSLGFSRHPPLATTVSEEDRWATIVYIRSLKPRG
jgi:mono/diheme cytochrome c family protein